MKWMFRIKFVFCLLILIGLTVSCAKKAPTEGRSLVSFSLPNGFANQSLAGTACFAVNIYGDGISTQTPSSCDGQYGLFSDLVPVKGGEIELFAPFGKGRTIEIYYVISSNGCQKFSSQADPGQLYGSNNVFRISQKAGINFDQPEVVVKMPIEYPRSSNSLSTLLSLPTSCEKNNSPVNAVAQINKVRLVPGAVHGVTDAGNKMSVRVYDQKLNMKSPTNFSGRIKPVRLGED